MTNRQTIKRVIFIATGTAGVTAALLIIVASVIQS